MKHFSNFQLPTFNFKLYPPALPCPASNFKLQTSNFKLQTSNFKLYPPALPCFKLQTSNFKLQTSNFKLQTSNFKLQTSNFKLQTSNFSPPCPAPLDRIESPETWVGET